MHRSHDTQWRNSFHQRDEVILTSLCFRWTRRGWESGRAPKLGGEKFLLFFFFSFWFSSSTCGKEWSGTGIIKTWETEWEGSRAQITAWRGARGRADIWEYTKIHWRQRGHKTTASGLKRSVLSFCCRSGSCRWIPPIGFFVFFSSGRVNFEWFGFCNRGTHTHTPNTGEKPPLPSHPCFSPVGPACLIFRHVQLYGFQDCTATCSNPSLSISRCEMSGGRP